MLPQYTIRDTSHIFSPALVFYKELILSNIARSIELAGGAERLRPHVKTHKTREIIRLEMEAGIRKHKCATIAEAEMVASCGVPDLLIAYPIVGPNCGRLARLMHAYPHCRFSVLADHAAGIMALSKTMSADRQQVDVLLDVDVGQHRTGIAPGDEAVELYEMIHRSPGLRAGGLHVYDGHNHQESFVERQAAIRTQLEPVINLRNSLLQKDLPVPRFVVGGTPTFTIHARLDIPDLECSPGTMVLHDHGYGSRFPDVAGFTPAALLLTRVISRPTPVRVTLDLGYKAVSSDPPAGNRCRLLDVPNYQAILQNEEHLVIETPAADRYRPGDEILAIPTHVCPTVALHRQAYVIENGQLSGTWEVAARDRVLSI
ncbi:MAG TPA: D-TA family PLP-dependent enzyme [Gemmataceae bacterium]|jgi:D-serine deaminase-like pyridoxal phosphate-dependent protein